MTIPAALTWSGVTALSPSVPTPERDQAPGFIALTAGGQGDAWSAPSIRVSPGVRATVDTQPAKRARIPT